MAAGFRDILAWKLHWHSAVPSTVVALDVARVTLVIRDRRKDLILDDQRTKLTLRDPRTTLRLGD